MINLKCKQWKFVVESFFKITEIYWTLISQIQRKCVHDKKKIPPFLAPLNSYTQYVQLSTEHMKISTAVLEIHVNVHVERS